MKHKVGRWGWPVNHRGTAITGSGRSAPTSSVRWQAPVLAALSGASNGLINATLGAVFGHRVPDRDRGRAGAAPNALTRTTSLAALALGALAGALTGPRTAITALGATTPLLLAVLVPWTTTRLRLSSAPPAPAPAPVPRAAGRGPRAAL